MILGKKRHLKQIPEVIKRKLPGFNSQKKHLNTHFRRSFCFPFPERKYETGISIVMKKGQGVTIYAKSPVSPDKSHIGRAFIPILLLFIACRGFCNACIFLSFYTSLLSIR